MSITAESLTYVKEMFEWSILARQWSVVCYVLGLVSLLVSSLVNNSFRKFQFAEVTIIFLLVAVLLSWKSEHYTHKGSQGMINMLMDDYITLSTYNDSLESIILTNSMDECEE